MRIRNLALATVLSVAAVSQAATLHGVTLPDGRELDGKKLVLNGMGVRKAIFGIKVYVAGLYVETKETAPEKILSSKGPKIVEIEFLRSVGDGRLKEAWTKSLTNPDHCGGDCAPLKARLETLNGWMKEMNSKDRLAFVFHPNGKVEVLIRNEKAGEIEGADFSKAMLASWIGSNPPNEDLKSGLLGHL